MLKSIGLGTAATAFLLAGCQGTNDKSGPATTSGSATAALRAGDFQGAIDESAKDDDDTGSLRTKTQIKHFVVIFGENISFDHYFATYPAAENNPGDPPFHAVRGTPKPNNLSAPLDPTRGFSALSGVNLLTANPTAAKAANGTGAVNPFRLSPIDAFTQDMDHNYKPEQEASDHGLMDLFPEFTGTAGPPPGDGGVTSTTGLVMGYFDGNTLGEIWSLAQNYAINDNSWTSTFGPSSPGAINLVSGQTNGIVAANKPFSSLSSSHAVADGNGGWTLIGDADPLGDVCSSASDQVRMGGKNIGDLLNARDISWGWFEGGFDLTITNPNGTTGCNRATVATVPGANVAETDYIPHHQPFQFYASTANPSHSRPSSVSAIGHTLEDDGVTVDPANHQYDSHDFFDALAAHNFPAVSFLKAPAFEDGHPDYSDPIDEQVFIDEVVAAVRASGDWESAAIVITYDDSDGWYDHQAPPIVNASSTTADALNAVGVDGGAGECNRGAQQGKGEPPPSTPLLGIPGDAGAFPAGGRCGYGTRIPLMLISPFAKKNYVDHTLTDQSSGIKFIEDNWLEGQRVQPGGSFDTIAGTIENMLGPGARAAP